MDTNVLYAEEAYAIMGCAFGKIIVKSKTIDRITQVDRGQVMNYLRITGSRLGISLNFKNLKLESLRVAL